MDGAMEPMLCLPAMDFQNQMPVRTPHMEQPQLSHPQAPPMSAPPQYMGQQNVGVPVYQPNGYVPPSQKQLGHNQLHRKRRPDDRRDSVNSNGSRSKVGDDPLHGPTFVMNPRKDRNTSTGRQPSNSDGYLAIDPTLPASKLHPECKNNRHGEKIKKAPYNFVDCPCYQCSRSSRSLFVKHNKLPMEKVRDALMHYLGEWGAVKVVVHCDGCGSTVL